MALGWKKYALPGGWFFSSLTENTHRTPSSRRIPARGRRIGRDNPPWLSFFRKERGRRTGTGACPYPLFAPLKGAVEKSLKGKMPAAHSPPWRVIPPSSVGKQILAPHSVGHSSLASNTHSSIAFDPRRNSTLIPSRRARAPYRGRAGVHRERVEGPVMSASKGSALRRRLRRLLRVRSIRWLCKTRGTRSLPGPGFSTNPLNGRDSS